MNKNRIVVTLGPFEEESHNLRRLSVYIPKFAQMSRNVIRKNIDD